MDQPQPKNDLRPYQRRGMEFLSNSTGALLAEEMGLGKTVQTACALPLPLPQSGAKDLVVALHR